MKTKTAYQPKTGEPCTCRKGAARDNCPSCEGTGQRIDFAAIRKVDHARDQAAAQLESIKEMVAALKKAKEAEVYDEQERAEQAIHEDALSVKVRSEWHDPAQMDVENSEYCILLCTGGPAVRLIGTLENDEPESARLEHQDWGTPWTEYRVSSEEEKTLLTYARCFYYGE